jgi:hypothetical protein
MSILLQLKNAAIALGGPLFRTALIADMTTIENEVNNLDIAVNGLTQNVTTSWVSGTTYAINDFRRSPINFQTYRRLMVGAGTVDPSADTTNWVAVAAGNSSQNINVAPATASTHAVPKGQLDAGAGHIGELQEQTLASGAALSLTTATALSIKAILLTAGTWDITGMAGFNTGATTNTTQFVGSISLTDNALGVEKNIGVIQYPAAGQVNVGQQFSLPTIRVTPAVSTTYYLVLRSAFSVSTTTGYGSIRATRVAL